MRIIVLSIFCLIACKPNTKVDIKEIGETSKSQQMLVDKEYEKVKVPLRISGDFNGDGKEEKLLEFVYNISTKAEEESFISDLNYRQFLDDNGKTKLLVNVIASDKKFKPLSFMSNNGAGLHWLRNIGDVNGDGADDISVVVNYADQSTINDCLVYAYANNEWKLISKFEIREWQIFDPDSDKFSGFIFKNASDEFIAKKYDPVTKQIKPSVLEVSDL